MPAATPVVHRLEVAPKPGTPDPIGSAVRRDAAALGIRPTAVHATHVYLIEAALSGEQVDALRDRLLADPVTEVASVGVRGAGGGGGGGVRVVEVHPLPGVMDPVAQSVELAVRELCGVAARVSTGWRYDLEGVSEAEAKLLAERLLANPVIQRVESRAWVPSSFAKAAAHANTVRSVAIAGLDDAALQKLSREAHLFLSLEEMRAIQAEYRRLGREPREIELETLAQTWSEHCVHKTLKSTVRYVEEGRAGGGKRQVGSGAIDWAGRPGVTVHGDGSVTIKNLLKSTVAAATFELIKEGIDWTLSVFTDNSGVVALDERWGVCIKVETHNRPSAIEPYGGAATGAGGCIRDVIGTGLGARPIANTDVFCVAMPEQKAPLPEGVLHPRRILQQVVAGVRDYGNRMGIPTVNGAVAFDDRYIGNPLVFCGCVGLIPRDKVKGQPVAGDRIVALGGRTGRDGVHGATFSSAAIEHTAADEFAHAVQIGNAIEEKRVLDAIMRARDEDPSGPLYSGMTDCGAGGFSSAVGEMGKDLGAEVHLERAPLKYDGLSFTEIWISEAQERMVLSVPPGKMAALKKICDEESVELADLGVFGTAEKDLVLRFKGEEVGRMSMHFLHEGIPMPVREGRWAFPSGPAVRAGGSRGEAGAALRGLLAHPTVASKHWIVRQYDHEVRGATVLKPLVGPGQIGPGDASVLEPVSGSGRGIAIGCGLQTPLGDRELGGDPYQMVLSAIDECVRNLVCVGADPERIAILDNFCWPSCGKPENMGALVRASVGCYDGAKAYRTPFVSGKDSLNNQFTTRDGRVIEIPYTLLITGLGMVPSLSRCVSMDAKAAGNVLVLVGLTGVEMGGALVGEVSPGLAGANLAMPMVDLVRGPRTARAVAGLIAAGLVRSAHDCSEGGLGVAVAEMLIAGASPAAAIGAELNLGALAWQGGAAGDAAAGLFAEHASRYVLEIRPEDEAAVRAGLGDVPHAVIGRLNGTGRLRVPLAGVDEGVGELTAAWRGTLDW
jgi:phosphoribosylformylglycinamidine synthase subunit PurSL